MLRNFSAKLVGLAKVSRIYQVHQPSITRVQNYFAPKTIANPDADDEDEFDYKYEAYLNKSDIDGWEVRRALNELHGMDLVPSPRVAKAALRACRRINDYALAVRFLESIKFKCGNHAGKIYPYMMEQLCETMEELGIDTLEAMGYDKPELVLKNVYDM